jgi:PAS domain S-box-containing protein
MSASSIDWPKGLREPDMPVLRAVVDAIPSRVSLVTPDHRYLYANREFLNFVGLTIDALVGRSAAEVLGPRVYAAFVETAKQVTATHAPNWEGWITFASGAERYLQVNMAPYAPGGDEVQAIFVFARDLSELKLRERELDESLEHLVHAETLHKAMVTFSPNSIILMDDQGVVVEFNPAAEATFGWTREEAVGQSIVDLIVPPDVRQREPSKLSVFKYLMDRDLFGQTLKRHAVRQDGRIIPIELTLTKVMLKSRELFMALCRDLSMDVRRKKELATSEAARDAMEQVNTEIVRSALDAFILADDKGIILDFNPAAEAMLGHSRAMAVGKSLSEMIVPHEHRAAHEAGMARYMATGQKKMLGRRVQVEALSAKGDLVPVEVTLNEVKLPDRHLFTAHMRDLREAKRAQAEIEAQRGRIHQIEKLSAMGSLLAGVAHELNNPLAILVAQSTLLREKAASDDVRQRAERIHAAADRAGRIVKSFLAMARQKPPSRQMTSINAMVRETLEMLAYGLRSAGVEVISDLDPAVPDIRVDSDLFRQVIANIVLNAQQALMVHPQPRQLTVRTRSGPDHVLIEIEDNGPGVAAELASRIFDPFFTTKPAGVGTGIGLAICKDVVQAHGGKLELVNPGQPGTSFRITMPLSTDEKIFIEQKPQGSQKPERILVVDDERDVGESLGEILETLGHSVVVSVSPRDALELIERETFDGVFVDLRMPEMSGEEFIRSLISTHPALAARTILMTGDTVRGPTSLLGAASDTPVLEKPFSLEEVVSILNG